LRVAGTTEETIVNNETAELILALFGIGIITALAGGMYMLFKSNKDAMEASARHYGLYK
jgi:hypothetical protein